MVISGFTLLGQLTLFAINALGRGTTFKTKIVTADQTPPDVFLSVHIPAYRKPASVLIGTLTKLLGQYEPVPHEVIVIINNTPHRADWQPVAQWCAKSGAPFKLLRRDGVVGAKVGAINIALAESDQRTTHIVTVDADYQVTPNFLSDIGAETPREAAHFTNIRRPTAMSNPPRWELRMRWRIISSATPLQPIYVRRCC